MQILVEIINKIIKKSNGRIFWQQFCHKILSSDSLVRGSWDLWRSQFLLLESSMSHFLEEDHLSKWFIHLATVALHDMKLLGSIFYSCLSAISHCILNPVLVNPHRSWYYASQMMQINSNSKWLNPDTRCHMPWTMAILIVKVFPGDGQERLSFLYPHWSSQGQEESFIHRCMNWSPLRSRHQKWWMVTMMVKCLREELPNTELGGSHIQAEGIT